VLLQLPPEGSQQTKETNMAVVTLECAGVLEGEKSLEILSHVEAAWERGQQAVQLLRQELPAESVDVMAPLRNGGVHLHKIFGVMHDTCHAANKVPTLFLRVCLNFVLTHAQQSNTLDTVSGDFNGGIT
jgi:hypothetical protein